MLFDPGDSIVSVGKFPVLGQVMGQSTNYELQLSSKS